MKKSNSSVGCGIGFCGLLQIAFIVLKLCGVIQWSWCWVLATTWASVTFAFILLVVSVWLYNKF